MKNSKVILICGGSGFMGSNFIRHLYTTYPDYVIYNLDMLTYAGNQANLADIEKKELDKPRHERRYIFLKGDIGNKALLEFIFSYDSFDVVINFAAESHVDRSILNSVEFIRTNIQGAYVLIEGIRTYKIPRYIYISTDEVYGDIPKRMKSDEDYPLRPSNPYSASKASADLMVQSYMKTHKIPAIIVRSSNNYGPFQYPEKLHPLIITNLYEGKKIPVHGTGMHIRSWLHVKDFCNALDIVMHKGRDFNIYNIAGEERTNHDVIKTILRCMKKTISKNVTYVKDRPGPDFRYSPDDAKIRKELGWRREHQYDKSILDVVQWYLDNRKWWTDIRRKPEFRDHYKKQVKGYYTFEEDPHFKRRWTMEKRPKIPNHQK